MHACALAYTRSPKALGCVCACRVRVECAWIGARACACAGADPGVACACVRRVRARAGRVCTPRAMSSFKARWGCRRSRPGRYLLIFGELKIFDRDRKNRVTRKSRSSHAVHLTRMQRELFDELCVPHYKKLLAYATALAGRDRELAREVMQDTYCQALRAWPAATFPVENDYAIRGWLKLIVHNTLIKHVMKRRVRARALDQRTVDMMYGTYARRVEFEADAVPAFHRAGRGRRNLVAFRCDWLEVLSDDTAAAVAELAPHYREGAKCVRCSVRLLSAFVSTLVCVTHVTSLVTALFEPEPLPLPDPLPDPPPSMFPFPFAGSVPHPIRHSAASSTRLLILQR